jgi:hypothetical protein
MDESRIFEAVQGTLEVTDERHARDMIRIVRAVLVAHNRDVIEAQIRQSQWWPARGGASGG